MRHSDKPCDDGIRVACCGRAAVPGLGALRHPQVRAKTFSPTRPPRCRQRFTSPRYLPLGGTSPTPAYTRSSIRNNPFAVALLRSLAPRHARTPQCFSVSCFGSWTRRPEPHVLLFRRPHGTDPVTGRVDPVERDKIVREVMLEYNMVEDESEEKH